MPVSKKLTMLKPVFDQYHAVYFDFAVLSDL